jgi:hypothetical protein
LCATVGLSISTSVEGNRGRRAGRICRGLGACPTSLVDTCVVTATNAGTTLTGRLDWCTREGVAFGRPVQGVAATSQVPAGKCRRGENTTADEICSFEAGLDNKFVFCTAGRDTVERIGTLQPTPCKRCRDCIANMQPYITSLSVSGAPTTPEGIGAAFAAACASPPFSRASGTCRVMADIISKSNQGNMGRRAGTLELVTLIIALSFPHQLACTPSHAAAAKSSRHMVHCMCVWYHVVCMLHAVGVVCSARGQLPAATCSAIAVGLRQCTLTPTRTGNTEFAACCRAGTLCKLLGDCEDTSMSDCKIRVGSAIGSFDACTAEGIDVGTTLAGVVTTAGTCSVCFVLV